MHIAYCLGHQRGPNTPETQGRAQTPLTAPLNLRVNGAGHVVSKSEGDKGQLSTYL